MFVQVFGQVYIPVVNTVLMALTMIVVGTFQTSARLGNAYGGYLSAYTLCPCPCDCSSSVLYDTQGKPCVLRILPVCIAYANAS